MTTRKLLLAVVWLLLVGGSALWGQDAPWNNQRSQWVAAQGSYTLDSLTVLPFTLRVTDRNGVVIDTAHYALDGRVLRWRGDVPEDSARVHYRVLPLRLDAPFTLIDTSRQVGDETGIIIGTYNPYAGGDGLGTSQRLNYNGSFSRGLSFGNRQDLVLNSSFNLQMAGEIGDGITVTAAISDENLPIQPEGNTRQLRDFDRIFIRLEKVRTQLTAGDYELRSPEGYFMQYFKKLEGATFQTSHPQGAGTWTHRVGAAVARGQFRRQQVVAIEGNQGPYKLQGGAGERFIIVLAGTEKVMLDGVALERGRDADYTIDYNQGEVVFMPRRLVTKDSRITVEFEYADQRYLRSLLTANTLYTTRRWTAYANAYTQQDSKTATGDLALSDEERHLLQAAGDQTEGATLPAISRLDAPDSQRATYSEADTLLNCNGRDTLVRYLRFDAVGLLVATFSFVGEGQGNYQLDTEQTANERVYRWVAPDPLTCQPRGNYEPIRQLVAPKQQRLLAAGGSYRTGKAGTLRAEVAYSQNDLNRFSPLDADDDEGWATRLDWEQRWLLSKDTSGWTLLTAANYEWVAADFRAVNPYRSPEFLRDWSLADVNGQGTVAVAEEQLWGGGVALQHPKYGKLDYRWSAFGRGAVYTGERHTGSLQARIKNWEMTATNSWLNTTAGTNATRFVRPSVQLQKRFVKWNNWLLQVGTQSERNERYTDATGTLAPGSFYFQRHTAAFSSPEQERWQWTSAVRTRRDYKAVGAQFLASTQASEGEIGARWKPSKAFSTNANLTYRALDIRDTALTDQMAARTLLGRVDVNASLWKDALRSNTAYEIGSGQEPRIEYVYLFVGAGQGQYVWLDSLYNNDGKIQPNEMEIAPFPDIADHIRVSIFTDDFIRTDNVTLNQSWQIDPARLWAKADKKWQRALARWSLQSSLSINRKVRALAGVQAWNPLQTGLPDSALVALTANQRHILFFNRRSTKFDTQLEHNVQPRRLVPTTGYESRLLETTTLRTRWNVTDASTLRLATARTLRTSDSEFFNNKDYHLDGYNLEPAISYQPGRDYRLTLAYKWLEERNRLTEGAEALQKSEFRVEGNYKQWLRASVNYIEVELAGDARSPVGFVLLNGLQAGSNWLWNAAVTRQLGRYLQMTLTYEGRKTGEAAPVHVGRAQVTAVF